MNQTQEFTPKYWIAHYKKNGDVLLDTESKCRSTTVEILEKQRRVSFETLEQIGYAIDLFELRIINLVEPNADKVSDNR